MATKIDIDNPPPDLKEAFDLLFESKAKEFVVEIIEAFDSKIDHLLRERTRIKVSLDATKALPEFAQSRARSDPEWQIAPLPKRLENRHLDIGDVAPSDTERLARCLSANVQGIQVDFDDGHCPTWRNQIMGWYNVMRITNGSLPGSQCRSPKCIPILMLRPRAWNMVDHAVLVNGKEVPGALLDFALLMYHNGRKLEAAEAGPCFYLSKLESAAEAKVWDELISWTEDKLGLPHGCTKTCVLIENVLASFEMEEILYALKDHSMGLNCGIWDYSASFINKFGHRREFILPDRSKYVNMERHFLKSYMKLVIRTCHKRGALATGGMAALLLPRDDEEKAKTVKERVRKAKAAEIKAGVDGFLVYDLGLVGTLQNLWSLMSDKSNQLDLPLEKGVKISPEDLLEMPSGGVTKPGLRANIKIGVKFIQCWLQGGSAGHFALDGSVEDSATAEISRSQVWQWIRHAAKLEDTDETVTRKMVFAMVHDLAGEDSDRESEEFQSALEIFKQVVTKRDFPEFITTYLNFEHAWVGIHF